MTTISLKEWQALSRLNAEAKAVIYRLDSELIRLLTIKTDEPTRLLIAGMLRRLEDVSLLYEIHPQSEWVGGPSDDPKNHRLREPNCVGLGRRYFTAEEIEEAGLVCLGPCDWVQKGAEDGGI